MVIFTLKSLEKYIEHLHTFCSPETEFTGKAFERGYLEFVNDYYHADGYYRADGYNPYHRAAWEKVYNNAYSDFHSAYTGKTNTRTTPEKDVKAKERMKKVQAIINDPAATEGEKVAARAALNRIKEKMGVRPW